MKRCLIVFFTAVVLDYIIGDPYYPFHPVRLFGKLISTIESSFFSIKFNGFYAGIILAVLVILIISLVFIVISKILVLFCSFLLFPLQVFAVYSCIAYRDLVLHVIHVYKAVMLNDIEKARLSVTKIVGRDVSTLDLYGIARAAIESLAENFVDGFLSPVFWYFAGCFAGGYLGIDLTFAGCLGILIYRAVNTMDSMIGYKNERYYYFGTAGARLDDLMNYIPARLSIIIVTAAAFFSGMNTSGCFRTGLRDRLKHASPNSGHPESCFAGALGLTLGGPSKYHGIIIDKPWIGKGSKEAGEEDILKALVLNKVSFFFTLFMVVILFFIFRVRY